MAGGSWDSIRSAFADQFEPYGNAFTYRKSQTGEAIRVSPEERQKFIDQFARDLRRLIWVIYLGIGIVLAGMALESVLTEAEISEPAIYLGMGAVGAIYWVLYRRSWSVPARELAGRIPVARARSPDEIPKKTLGAVSYGQLGFAAVAAAAVPFFVSGKEDVFSGWHQLWLLFGAALVGLVLRQAYRKWRFEQDERTRGMMRPAAALRGREVNGASAEVSPGYERVLRFMPAALLFGAIAFVAYTARGRQVAQQPYFFPGVFFLVASWALFTVARAITTGTVEPLLCGSVGTFDRETQPKRFWASTVWNAMVSYGLFWGSYTAVLEAPGQQVRNRCGEAGQNADWNDVIAACDRLIEEPSFRDSETQADALVLRGNAYLSRGHIGNAIADYTAAIRQQPDGPTAYYDRGLANSRRGDLAGAMTDFNMAVKLAPEDSESRLERGLLFLNEGEFDSAIADFDTAHALKPQDPLPIANRGISYSWKKDAVDAAKDFDAVERIDPGNPVALRGRALLSMNALNFVLAIKFLTASMQRDPNSLWAIRQRAYAYRQVGDDKNADADIAKYEKLSGYTAFSSN